MAGIGPTIVLPIITACIVSAVVAPVIPTCAITLRIADAKIIPAAIAQASLTVLDPVSPAIASVLNAIGTCLAAAINPVGAKITPTFDLSGPCFGLAIDALCGCITAALVTLVGTEVTALFDLCGPEFAAAVNLLSADITAALDSIGAHLCAVFGLLSSLSLLGLAHYIGAKSARLARILAGLGVLRTGRTILARFGAQCSVAASVRRALGAGFAASGIAPVIVILRNGSGGNGKGKRQRQGYQRSTFCKTDLHCSDSRIAGPPQAAC